MSQVDSSIGGKTGVNTKYGKNLVGSFYQPNLVISDTEFLKTLPNREIVCGYGEILKHSIIGNKKFYNFLNNHKNKILNLTSPFLEKAIYESCKIKKAVVEKDEKETLKNLKLHSSVISLGGGAFMNENIRKEVLKSHISFWLNWNNNILLGRIKNSKKRPLAINSSDDQIIDLIQERSTVYAKALFEIKILESSIC